jgi:hypothetical protein
MLRFIAASLVALALGLMVGATLAATTLTDAPDLAMLQRMDPTTPISGSTTVSSM